MDQSSFKKVTGTVGSFTSKIVSTKTFKKGETVAQIQCKLAPAGAPPTYQTVQIGPTKHINLLDDLVFMNHSCDPNTHWDLDTMIVVAERDIAPGDELTFFYPSSEWDMAQPFECRCGAPCCLKTIRGAKYVPAQVLSKYKLTSHIEALVRQQKP